MSVVSVELNVLVCIIGPTGVSSMQCVPATDRRSDLAGFVRGLPLRLTALGWNHMKSGD
eukprot:SAG22_NODE_13939_length_390_cov_0.865979_1_plen_58_part_10